MNFFLLGQHSATLSKVIYLDNRRFLETSDTLRWDHSLFPNGTREFRPAPNARSVQEEDDVGKCLDLMNQEVASYPPEHKKSK